MKAVKLKQIPCDQFFARLSHDSLSEGFVRYLSVRIAEQQQVIANLVTVDSEQRLGKTLLQLARSMGKKDPHSIRIELKITHEELSEMVGTTRPRISLFINGLIISVSSRPTKTGFLSSKKRNSPITLGKLPRMAARVKWPPALRWRGSGRRNLWQRWVVPSRDTYRRCCGAPWLWYRS